jgi:tetratricopeptide (TPR) repeat protein
LKTLKKLRVEKSDDEGRLGDLALPFRAYGIALMVRNKLRTATREFANAIEVEPRDFRAHFGLCHVLATRLKAKAALKACRAAMVNPAYTPARRLLARVAEAHGDHGAVIEALEALAAENILTSEEWSTLGRAYVESDRVDDLLEKLNTHRASIEDGIQIYLGALSARAKKVPVRAKAEMARAARRLPQTVRVQVDYARLLIAGREFDQAKKILEKAMKLAKDPLAPLSLAQLHVSRRQWESASNAAGIAVKWASQSLSHPRVRADALAIQGLALIARKGRKGARRAGRILARALRLEPDIPRALLGQGLMYGSLRKWGRAETAFRRLIQVAPNDAQAQFQLGRVLGKQRRKKSEARRAFSRALELDPKGIWGLKSKRAMGGRRRRR